MTYPSLYGDLYGGSIPPVAVPPITGWPNLILEAGLTPVFPVYPPGTLLLDDTTVGILDTDTLGGSTSWVDITIYARSIDVTRPSSRQQGPVITYQAGTLSVTLDNSDGTFDPDNPASIFYPSVRPMVPVRLRATLGSVNYYLFHGFADGWQPAAADYEGGYAEMTLSATDGFKVLAGQTLAVAASQGTAEFAGARATRILNAAGWYSDHRQIAAGNTQMQPTTLGDSPLNLLQLTADTELSEVYINGRGDVVFRAKQSIFTDSRSMRPQAVFGDSPGTAHMAGTELAYALAPARADDDTLVVNDVQITAAVGGGTQEVKDNASISQYLFPRTYTRDDLLLDGAISALDYAQGILYLSKHGDKHYDQLTIDPLADLANLFPQVLGRDICDRIQVWTRPVALPAALSRDVFIRGISHSIDLTAYTWVTTWDLQDAARYDALQPLTLDSVTGWSFTASGTPTDGTYFIVTTGQAASITVGDYVTDTSNPGVLFEVYAIGPPAFGFNNIQVTPTATVIMSNPDVVTQVSLDNAMLGY